MSLTVASTIGPTTLTRRPSGDEDIRPRAHARARAGSERRSVQPRAPRPREIAQRALERHVIPALRPAPRVAVLDHVATGVALLAPHAQRALSVAQAGSEHERSNGHRFPPPAASPQPLLPVSA